MSKTRCFAVIAAAMLCIECGGSKSANPQPTSSSPVAPTAPATPAPGQTLTATQHGQVISNLTLTSTAGPCIVVSGLNDVWIDHVQLGPCAAQGIRVEGAARLRITNSIIHTGHGGQGQVDSGDGVYIRNSTDVIVQGNQFADNETSVETYASRNTSIIGNYSLNPLGPFPRGQHFQLTNGSDGSQITDNFGEQNPRFRGPVGDQRYIEDAINIYQTGDVTIARNYLRGGDAENGCGIIAGDSNGGIPGNGVTITDNVMVRTSNCGIGVAGGSGHVVRRNRILDTNFEGGSGNIGIYVWDYRSLGTCSNITVRDNIVSNLLPNGTFADYWDGGNCRSLDIGNNTFGNGARALLTPEGSQLPAPSIPPRSYP